jgi:hypothetical protein
MGSREGLVRRRGTTSERLAYEPSLLSDEVDINA